MSFRAAALTVALLASATAGAGTFIFSEGNGADIITHATGYTGTSGTYQMTVCIDPTSPNAAAMEIPIQNNIAVLNQRLVTTGNVQSLGSGQFDFESVSLHEMGHAVGLAHVNLATESGVGGADQNYTKSLTGGNGSYDLGIGSDGIRGSPDDLRGDDQNLFWFNVGVNNPFGIFGTVDEDTYSQSLGDLPGADNYPANPDFTVSSLYGAPNTEGIMQQGTFSNERQRTLAADEIATLALAETGLDEQAGTADDYILQLVYGGFGTGCDIDVTMGGSPPDFAVTSLSGNFIAPAVGSDFTHLNIEEANMFFNPSIAWFFNQVSVVTASIQITKSPASQNIQAGETANFSITVENTGSVDLENVTVTDALTPDCDSVIGDLAAGSDTTYNCQRTSVTASFTNVADVSGDPVGGGSAVTDSDSADVIVVAPAISISKTPDDQQVLNGGNANFNIFVQNTGNTVLNNIAVSDALVPDCDANLGSLNPGQSTSYGCQLTGVSADFTNTADVTADPPSPPQVSDSDTADVDVINPSISITKTTVTPTVPPGGDMDFDISVENTGDATLTGVTVSDPLSPDCNASLGSLAPAEVSNYSCTAFGVNEDFTNVASVSGTPPLGPDVTDQDSAPVLVFDPNRVFTDGFE